MSIIHNPIVHRLPPNEFRCHHFFQASELFPRQGEARNVHERVPEVKEDAVAKAMREAEERIRLSMEQAMARVEDVSDFFRVTCDNIIVRV